MSFKSFVKRIDNFQREHKATAFIYAVIKKYGQDNGGYQSALVGYYAVLSLFPLLVAFTSLAKLVFSDDTTVRHQLSQLLNRYFPVVGGQIQQGIHDPGKTGMLFVITVLIILYGSRGVANALQFTLSSVWRVPRFSRPPFIFRLTRSISIIIIIGVGTVLASIISGYVVHLGHSTGLKILATIVSLVIIWLMLIGIFKLAIAGDKKVSEVWRGAAVASVGLQILQLVGNIVLAHELKNLDTRYGVFGLAIGLMLWLYLQAEVIIYAAQVDAVRHFHLYPRSINEPADLKNVNSHF